MGTIFIYTKISGIFTSNRKLLPLEIIEVGSPLVHTTVQNVGFGLRSSRSTHTIRCVLRTTKSVVRFILYTMLPGLMTYTI